MLNKVCSCLIGALLVTALPNEAPCQESWTGDWQAAGFSVDGLVCRQDWKCVDPGKAPSGTAADSLVFEPATNTTEGVCESSSEGPDCAKCVAEQPPEDCIVKLTKK